MVKDYVDPPSIHNRKSSGLPSKSSTCRSVPPLPLEEIVDIEPTGPIKKEESVSWVDYIFNKPKSERFSADSGVVPKKPSTYPNNGSITNRPPPTSPRPKRGTHYKIITGTPGECEDALNYYNGKNLVVEIITMTSTERYTTILIKVYDGH